MAEFIYLLTTLFTTYVVYVSEGDNIVAFIKRHFNIDLTHPHACCTATLDRIRAELAQWKAIGAGSPALLAA